MELIDILRTTWFFLIGVLFVGYSILDGFDLGTGILFPFIAKNENEKKTLFSIIWPFWDGNEVWLLAAGGALFAAFPLAYATIFSGFYLPLMLVLFGLILRAVSIEFWHYDQERQGLWQFSFCFGSLLPSFLYGIALGNVVFGVRLDHAMEFAGSFFELLKPLPLMTGFLGLAMIVLHGSVYICLKTEGDLRDNAVRIASRSWIIVVMLFIAIAVAGIAHAPALIGNILALGSVFITLLALLYLRTAISRGQERKAFIASSSVFAGLWAMAAAALFPRLLTASNDSARSITISNASSSELTLTVMTIIAAIGMPLVIGYTIFVYRVFKGKAMGIK